MPRDILPADGASRDHNDAVVHNKTGRTEVDSSVLPVILGKHSAHKCGGGGMWQLSGAAVDFPGHLLVLLLGNDTPLAENAVEIVQPQLSGHSFSGGYGHVIPPERRIAGYGGFYTAIAPWAHHTH